VDKLKKSNNLATYNEFKPRVSTNPAMVRVAKRVTSQHHPTNQRWQNFWEIG
jgi:hypothetical protein